ncbi:MAG: undecaprenyl-diphosphate phosphatase [Patescibacteria group bacterium]
MDYIYSIFFGIVQGLTEFLPISSSGHLVILHKLVNFRLQDDLSFDVILHAGTLVALLVFFYKDIITYLAAFFKSLVKWNLKNDANQRLAWFILAAAIPAGIFGYLLEDTAESTFRSPFLVAAMFIIVGIFFLILEKFSQKTKELKDMGLFGAVIIGLCQAIALIPGVSRSGITIIAGLSQKLKREEAARFSFLLSIPVIFGAVIKKLTEFFSHSFSGYEMIIYVLGFSAAFLAGYFAVRFLLNYLKNHSLNIFAYYRFGLAVIVIMYFLIF